MLGQIEVRTHLLPKLLGNSVRFRDVCGLCPSWRALHLAGEDQGAWSLLAIHWLLPIGDGVHCRESASREQYGARWYYFLVRYSGQLFHRCSQLRPPLGVFVRHDRAEIQMSLRTVLRRWRLLRCRHSC